MTNSKKIEYASVDLTTTYAAVVDGQVKFRENTANHILKNFFVRSVYVQEWNAV